MTPHTISTTPLFSPFSDTNSQKAPPVIHARFHAPPHRWWVRVIQSYNVVNSALIQSYQNHFLPLWLYMRLVMNKAAKWHTFRELLRRQNLMYSRRACPDHLYNETTSNNSMTWRLWPHTVTDPAGSLDNLATSSWRPLGTPWSSSRFFCSRLIPVVLQVTPKHIALWEIISAAHRLSMSLISFFSTYLRWTLLNKN